MTQTKKGRAQDRAKVSLQPWEIDYIQDRHQVKRGDIVAAVKSVKSRKRDVIYAELRLKGYLIITNKFPNG